MFASAMHNNNGTTTGVLVYVQATFCQCAQMSPQLFRRIFIRPDNRLELAVKYPVTVGRNFAVDNPCA